MIELIQKSFGSSKEFRVAKDRLMVKTKSINKYEEYYVKFDSLGLDLTRKQTKSILLLIPLYIALAALEIYVFIDEYKKGSSTPIQLTVIGAGAVLFVIGAVYSFFQKTDKVFIQGGTKVLELNGSNPSRLEVDNFIKDLQSAIREYYKRKYAVVDPTLEEIIQIQNYKWLRETEIINEAEYEELVNTLKIKNL